MQNEVSCFLEDAILGDWIVGCSHTTDVVQLTGLIEPSDDWFVDAPLEHLYGLSRGADAVQ